MFTETVCCFLIHDQHTLPRYIHALNRAEGKTKTNVTLALIEEIPGSTRKKRPRTRVDLGQAATPLSTHPFTLATLSHHSYSQLSITFSLECQGKHPAKEKLPSQYDERPGGSKTDPAACRSVHGLLIYSEGLLHSPYSPGERHRRYGAKGKCHAAASRAAWRSATRKTHAGTKRMHCREVFHPATLPLPMDRLKPSLEPLTCYKIVNLFDYERISAPACRMFTHMLPQGLDCTVITKI